MPKTIVQNVESFFGITQIEKGIVGIEHAQNFSQGLEDVGHLALGVLELGSNALGAGAAVEDIGKGVLAIAGREIKDSSFLKSRLLDPLLSKLSLESSNKSITEFAFRRNILTKVPLDIERGEMTSYLRSLLPAPKNDFEDLSELARKRLGERFAESTVGGIDYMLHTPSLGLSAAQKDGLEGYLAMIRPSAKPEVEDARFRSRTYLQLREEMGDMIFSGSSDQFQKDKETQFYLRSLVSKLNSYDEVNRTIRMGAPSQLFDEDTARLLFAKKETLKWTDMFSFLSGPREDITEAGSSLEKYLDYILNSQKRKELHDKELKENRYWYTVEQNQQPLRGTLTINETYFT